MNQSRRQFFKNSLGVGALASIPNAGPYHEFKGINKKIPLTCKTSSLTNEDGVVTVPSGPGLGVDFDPDFIAKHKRIGT